ncbi:MAG: hypothetical protein PHY62_09720 [Gallionella sp.]|nr:hypothetical protein [Gallionella sp.]
MINLITQTLPRPEPIVVDGAVHPAEHFLDFKTFLSLRRMVGHQQKKSLIGRADFVKQLTLYLPDVAARIEDSDFGIVHLEVGTLRLATYEAVIRNDFATVRRHLFVIDEVFSRADKELYDAIRISYLEALFFGVTSAGHFEARCLLSQQMENVLKQSELRWSNVCN